jgi:NADH:ubiquinone oxidoreductase subunit H
MFLFSIFLVNVFLGGFTAVSFFPVLGYIAYISKIMAVSAVFIVLMASLPRYRYDQLMLIG